MVEHVIGVHHGGAGHDPLARALSNHGDIGLAEDWLPEDADIQVTSSEFADLDPPEYRADVVLRVTPHARGDSDANDRDRATREVFIVEVQLDPDQLKHFTWPQYVTAARTRFRCPATLVVVAVDERVARWCAQPITLDRAGNVFRPVVIGPAAIPVVTDEAEARIWPELAVLSVIAHGHETGSEVIGAAALAACDRLDSAQARLYADLIYSASASCPPMPSPGSTRPTPIPWMHGFAGCSPRAAWRMSSPPSPDSSALAPGV